MKITVLAENHAEKKGIKAEHGLSLYIETQGKNILFDMGQRDCFLENAKQLDVNIKDVDVAVLSHGHYDHGGGAMTFLEENKTSPLYVNRNVFGRFFSKNGYIGLDLNIQLNDRVVTLDKTKEIFENIVLAQGNEFCLNEDNFSSGLEREIEYGMVKDDFLHEQYLLINEGGKKILISGCSHRGILNIMEHFKPDVFVGGLHLSGLAFDSEKLKYVSEKLSKYNAEYYTCHCTGIEQYGTLKQYLGNRLHYINCGSILYI